MDVLRVSDTDECSNHAFPYRSKIVVFTFLGSLYRVPIHQAGQFTAVPNSLGIGHNSLMNNLIFFYRPEGSRFQDNQHMKVISLVNLHTGRLYPQEIFLVLISVRS
jgi:hypothetical protein